MSPGTHQGNLLIASAFRAALARQGLIALLIFALLGAAWLGMRRWRPAGRASAGPVAAPEPSGRRLLAIGFGNLWLFDAILQAQPGLALGMATQVIEPAAARSPLWVKDIAAWAAAAWSYHPLQAAAAAVWIQAGLGIWLLAAPYGPLSRLAGLVSAAWGTAVWVVGESFGGLFAPGSSWMFGAPGAALAYAAAGALLALPDRAWRSPRLGRLTLAALGLFLAGMAVLQAWPGRGSWRGIWHGQLGPVAGMAQTMALTPQPRLLADWVFAFGRFDEAHGFAVNLAVVLVLAGVGAAFASGRPRLAGPALAVFAAASLADWVLVQDLGFLGGLGTDPNSVIPLTLLAAGGYLAWARVPAVTAELAAGTENNAAAPGPHPARLPVPAGRASALPVVAVGGACMILLGAVPVAVAQAGKNADPILAESIAGPAVRADYPAPGFTLTDQAGRTVTLASLRGKVVLLAFAWRDPAQHCPPAVREMGRAAALLGSLAREVALVEIGPQAAPRQAVKSQASRCAAGPGVRSATTGLTVLTGPPAAVRAAWRAYGIGQPGAAGPAQPRRDVVFVIGTRGQVIGRYRTGRGTPAAAVTSSFAALFADATLRGLAASR